MLERDVEGADWRLPSDITANSHLQVWRAVVDSAEPSGPAQSVGGKLYS